MPIFCIWPYVLWFVWSSLSRHLYNVYWCVNDFSPSILFVSFSSFLAANYKKINLLIFCNYKKIILLIFQNLSNFQLTIDYPSLQLANLENLKPFLRLYFFHWPSSQNFSFRVLFRTHHNDQPRDNKPNLPDHCPGPGNPTGRSVKAIESSEWGGGGEAFVSTI